MSSDPTAAQVFNYKKKPKRHDSYINDLLTAGTSTTEGDSFDALDPSVIQYRFPSSHDADYAPITGPNGPYLFNPQSSPTLRADIPPTHPFLPYADTNVMLAGSLPYRADTFTPEGDSFDAPDLSVNQYRFPLSYNADYPPATGSDGLYLFNPQSSPTLPSPTFPAGSSPYRADADINGHSQSVAGVDGRYNMNVTAIDYHNSISPVAEPSNFSFHGNQTVQTWQSAVYACTPKNEHYSMTDTPSMVDAIDAEGAAAYSSPPVNPASHLATPSPFATGDLAAEFTLEDIIIPLPGGFIRCKVDTCRDIVDGRCSKFKLDTGDREGQCCNFCAKHLKYKHRWNDEQRAWARALLLAEYRQDK
ncbi:hypothetical protein diail_7451 [Diaporthe ilicicola]|nr:hypothetical protein diail_7451 [Diaporthe ilicicola]